MSKAQTTAKSGGPRTAEGKARSSRNAMRHGLTAQTLVLNHEDASEFADFRQCYIDTFQPANFLEAELVDEMVKAKWRLKRASLYEKLAIDTQHARLRKIYSDDDVTETIKIGAVSKAAEVSSFVRNLPRYESRLERAYYRALNKLLDLRAKNLSFGELQPTLETLPAPDAKAATGDFQTTPQEASSFGKNTDQPKPEPATASGHNSSSGKDVSDDAILSMSDRDFERMIGQMINRAAMLDEKVTS